ncbi:MAG: hypothetical protein ACK6DP_19390 [Gemmatimonas sp.]|uniref:hypothetical protein n=1 Tax=Gemmatimonas sp. TaxID=1962908 RepID=UPI00391FA369
MPPLTTPRPAAWHRAVGAFVRWSGSVLLLLPAAACEHPTPTPADPPRGTLVVQVTGLPAGADADVHVTGPNGFARTLTGSDVLSNLMPGRYLARAGDVRVSGFTWSGMPSSADVGVPTGDTSRLAIGYELATGALAVTVTGLPGGVVGAVRISGPGGLTRVASGSVVFGDLPPGSYTVRVDSVNAGGTAWRSPAAPDVRINASTVPSTLLVPYENVTGRLVLGATGLPAGVRPRARVQGPLQVDRFIVGGEVASLPVGSYQITPLAVSALPDGSGPSWSPASRSVPRVVTTATADTVTVSYASNPSAPNLTIDRVTITQAVQRADNSIPLVAGREALLRAYGRAARAGVRAVPARVRLFEGTTVLGALVLTPPVGSVPLEPLESDLASTYAIRLAGDLVRSSLRLVVDVDPDSTLGETQRSDNVWPAGATPRALNATVVPPFTVRFVPVTIGTATGDISARTQTRFLHTARTLWPLAQVTSDVRTPLVSAAPVLHPTDANGAWTTVLSELRALRLLDGAPPTTHYYGVVPVPYDSGTFGLGLVGSPTAVGWDRADADVVAAHEWGHNFGRLHAPCGDPPNADPQFPSVGGLTGTIGWDARTSTVFGPTTADIMGYCTPAWVSEYSYTRVLAFRQAAALSAPRLVASPGEADGLLVWGRVVRGALVLEPATDLHAPITPPAGAPTHVVDLLDADLQPLISWPIEAEVVDHGPRRDQIFAVVLPFAGDVAQRLAHVRVRDVRTPLVAATRPYRLRQRPPR